MQWSFRRLSTYICAQVFRGWADAIILYLLIAKISKFDDSNSVFLIPTLALPPFIHLLLSPFFTRWVDKKKPTARMRLSVFLRLLSAFLLLIALLYIINENISNIVYFFLAYKALDNLDDSLHGPTPFILAKTVNVNLVRFRVSQVLLFRGANTFTPIVAVFFLDNLWLALVIILGMNLLSLAACLFLSHVDNKAPYESAYKSTHKLQDIVIIIYSVLLFLLNATFANTAAALLFSQIKNSSKVPILNSVYFLGFVVGSVILILFPKLISDNVVGLRNNLRAISFVLFGVGAIYACLKFLPMTEALILLLFSGFLYAVNLHLVTTQLPSLLEIDHIYSSLNYGRISGGMGSAVSGLWVGWFANSQYGGFALLSVMGFLSLCVAMVVFVTSVVLKKQPGHRF